MSGGDPGGDGVHRPVLMSRNLPGRQNGEQPLVTPTSPGRHAELTAGLMTVPAAASADAQSTAPANRRAASLMPRL
jgi:hypothetical protein